MSSCDKLSRTLIDALQLVKQIREEVPAFEKWTIDKLYDLVNSLPGEQRDAFVFAGATKNNIGYPHEHFVEILGTYPLDTIVDLAVHWFIFGFSSDPAFKLRQMLSRSAVTRVLHRVIREAPDDSPAPAMAARALLNERESLSSTEIEEFRQTWNLISPRRREAIIISLHPDPFRHFGRGEGITVVQGGLTRLELVAGKTDFPVGMAFRPRWIDLEFPTVRRNLWMALNSAITDFADDAPKLGHEREQVGALVQHLMSAMRRWPWQGQQSEHQGAASGGIRGRMEIDRYLFRVKEENQWGPDFAFILIFKKMISKLQDIYCFRQKLLIMAL